MYEFALHRPASLAEASKLHGGDADRSYLAGGMTLIPTLKHRLARPSDLIDLAKLAELRGISVAGGTVTLGAMVRHADVAASAEVRKAIPALAAMAELIGDAQVRNRGTIGGSVANNDPAADYPAALLALGAIVHTDKRAIPADDFFQGMFTTALEPGELIVRIAFPAPRKAAYQKFPNPASRYAMVGVFVADTASGPRVAVTGAGPGVFRVPAMEEALKGGWSADRLKGIAVPAEGLNSDIHASAEYRAHLIGVMARRAVAAAG